MVFMRGNASHVHVASTPGPPLTHGAFLYTVRFDRPPAVRYHANEAAPYALLHCARVLHGVSKNALFVFTCTTAVVPNCCLIYASHFSYALSRQVSSSNVQVLQVSHKCVRMI